MTNREWLNSLSDEDFATWLTMPSQYDCKEQRYNEPHPRLAYLKNAYTNFYCILLKWLAEERDETNY